MDAARLANAVVALDCTPAALTWKSGVGFLSLGGTKNSCMSVEAVILFDPKRLGNLNCGANVRLISFRNTAFLAREW